MDSSIKASHIEPSVIAFDVFGTLIKIGDRRSPYRKLMKWLKENGRQPKPDHAIFIMFHNLNLAELAKRLAANIPDQFLQELKHDLDEELRSITLFEDTLSTLEELKKLGFKLALCSNLAMPYGKIVSSLLPLLDAYAWSYEVAAIKPEPKIYQSLIDQLDCQASEVLFIGDTALAGFTGLIAFGISARLINRKNCQTLADVLNDVL
ncbi:hydrolase [Acinetobacter ursingii]|uniref:HAD family hydrolase n=1 Tax=Acinetobacter ursingii TaxID=108980 RepID=UPI000CF20B5F|nr:HAD family hydrolase [Acinetobacter ursingii]PPZ95391.1 hydrolase [Acinetobacter ursingii]